MRCENFGKHKGIFAIKTPSAYAAPTFLKSMYCAA